LKPFFALALTLLVSAAVAAPASAFTPGGPFQLTGPFVVASPPTTCTATFTVVGTPGAGGVITNVAFTGAPLCSTLSTSGLPWTMTALSATAVKITPFAVRGALFNCAAPSVTGSWSNAGGGVATFSAISVPPCVITTTLSASPAQTLP